MTKTGMFCARARRATPSTALPAQGLRVQPPLARQDQVGVPEARFKTGGVQKDVNPQL